MINAQSVEAHNALGYVLWRRRRWTLPSRFNKALQINPKHAPALNNLGAIYEERNQIERPRDV